MGRRRNPDGTTTRRGWFRASLRLLVLALAVHLLLPQLAGLEATAEALARSTLWAAVTAILLEAASLWTYGELARALLRDTGERAPFSMVQRWTLAQNALARSLPGGSMAAFPLVLGGLHRAGVESAHAAAALAGAGLLSAVTLALLMPVGAVLSIVGGVGSSVSVGALILAGAVLVGAVAIGAAARRPDAAGALAARAAGIVARGPLRDRVDPDRVATSVSRGVRQLDRLARRPGRLAVAAWWAVGNWVFDAAALLVIAVTVGAGTPLASVLIIYIIGQLVAALPITPGGVGLVEPAMVGAFVAAGAPAPAATASVLGWRLISHWLPIPVGLAALPARRRTPPGGSAQE